MSFSVAPSRTLHRILFVFAVLLLAAGAAQAQPTLSKVFTPNTIGPGSVTTATLTITNGAPAPVINVSFTDVLPAAVTLADPANASSTCALGIGGSLSAPDGGSTITLTDAQVGGFSSCTVIVDVTSSTPGVHTNPSVTLSSSAGSSMSLPIDLTVSSSRPGFSKSFSPSSVSLGGRSTLTFTIDNSLNAAPVGNLDFVDNLPAGMVVADPSNASSDCVAASLPSTTVFATPGSNSVVLDANGNAAFPGFQVLSAGATCTVTVDVTATGIGMLDNVTNELRADFNSVGRASDTLEVSVTPLAITKSFTDDPVPPGNSVTLEFTITNFDRNFPATGVAFTDDLATLVPPLAGLTFDTEIFNDCGPTVTGLGGTVLGLSGGTIPAEGTCTIRVDLAVPAGATPGAYANTSSTVTATVGGSPVVGNVATDTLFVESVPILTKEFLEVGTLNPNPVVQAGDDVVLRFTVTNPSTTSAATNIAFADELTYGGPGTGFLPFPIVIVSPSLPAAACGGTLSLTFFDTDRQGVSLAGGSLTAAPGAGATCTFDITLTIPSTFPPGVYTNTTGTPTATVDGAMRTGEAASDTLTVIAAPQLTKTFSDDPVAPGGTVTLEFALSHSGNSPTDATGITFTDNLATVLTGLTANLPPSPDPPCGVGSTLTGSAGDTLLTLAGGTLMPGEDCTFTVTLNVPAGAAPGTYPNTTSGVGATVLGQPVTSDPSSDDLDVQGLVFTKEFLGDPVIAGDTVNLRFTIANIHPTDDATITFFSDNLATNLPGLAATGAPTVNTCGGTLSGTTNLTYAGGSVLSGASCTIEVPVMVPAAAADGDYMNVTSSLITDQGAVAPAVDTLVVSSSLLFLTKQFTDDPVAPGDSVTLEFVLTNQNPSQAASGIGFTDDLGAALTGLIFDSVMTDTCLGTVGGTTTTLITVSGVGLAAGASCTIEVVASVPGGASDGVYTNTTSDVTGTIGGFPVNGTPATDDLDVVPLLLFTKAFDGPTSATGTAMLTFTIVNPGSSTASDIQFSDDLNAVIPGLIATSLPTLPCGAASSMSGISFLTFSGGELPPSGGMCTFDVEVLVPATATAGTYPNTTSNLLSNGLQVANPAIADLTIEPPPTFTKAFSPNILGLGQVSTLAFTVDNSASAVVASSLAFIDNLPAGTAVATVPAVTNSCGGSVSASPGSGTISLSSGSVNAGASCTVTVDVQGTAIGSHLNTTGDLTSSSGNSGTASDTLTVVPLPTFAKAFAPAVIPSGGTSTLTFTVDNTASSLAASSLAFTDNLPAAVTVAAVPNVVNACGGSVTAVAGSGVISLTGGTAPATSSCTVSVDVTSSTVGDHVNLSGNLSSSQGTSGTATDTLTVAAPPTFAKVFAPDVIPSGTVSTLTFTIDNAAAAIAATGLDFTDNLPAAVTVATPSNASTTCTGGTLTAADGSGTITYTSGTAAAGASCAVMVDVTSSTVGAHVNMTGDLTSNLGNSGTATDTLTVPDAPVFAKAFAPDVIPSGTVSTLTFTLDNTASTLDATSVDFTDSLPAAVTVATPSNAATTCTGGTLTATAGSGTITYTGGTIPAGASCTVTVDVVSSTVGDHVNLTGDLTSSLGSSGTATDTLTVAAMPGFSKAFAPSAIPIAGVSTLTFTIDNTGSVIDATSVDFTDSLPAAVTVSTPSNAATTCTGGTLTATAGSGTITYTGGTVSAMSSCTVTVDVTSSTVGDHVNLTGDLTSNLGNSGTATDTLTVAPVPLFSKAFAPALIPAGAVSTLTFTLDNSASVLDATSVDFTDNLPAAVTVATPSNAATTCTGGTLSAVDGSGTITYAGGTVSGGATCTVTVDVTSSTVGDHVNLTGDLTSSLGNSGTATGTLSVAAMPLFSKAFSPTVIPSGGVSTLTFTIDNSAAGLDATGLDFTDNLPAAVTVATPSNASTTCTGGTLTAVDGSGTITYTGGTVSAGASCTVTVDVTSSTAGDHVNLTGDLTSVLGNSGTATDTLTVPPAPAFSKTFAPDLVGVGGTSALTFLVDNAAGALPADGLAFVDTLPAGVEISATPNVANTCGGTVTAAPGGTAISLSGGTVGAGAACTVQVDVVGTVLGSHVNMTGDLTSTLGNSGTATDTLDVVAADLTLAKTIQANPILPGGFVDVEYTLTNLSALLTATGLTFSDDYDAALTGLVATTLPGADPCGAGSTVTGASVATLAGGNLAPLASCTFTVTLQVPADAPAGSYPGATSPVDGMAGGVPVMAPAAVDTLDVAYLEFAKSFSGMASAGGEVLLTFVLTNPDPVNDATGLTFTDDLDAVLPGLAAVGLPADGVCGLGSQVSGTSIIQLVGGIVAAGGSCTFDVAVSVPTSAPTGTFINLTSVLEGDVGGIAVVANPAAAEADLVVQGNPVAIPVNAPWALLLLVVLIGALATRQIRLA